jgi:hypothetical protein
MGGHVLLGRRVTGCRFDFDRRIWTVQAETADGGVELYEGEHLISSMPVRELVAQIEPRLPAPVINAAQSLKYRDFLTVGLIVREPNKITDNWIYIHDPSVKVGRIQNYKSWSPEMVPDPAYCSYGLEYFCFEGDGLWAMSDEDLIALAIREIEQIGLGRAADVSDGCVIRQLKAYPVYDEGYAKARRDREGRSGAALHEHSPGRPQWHAQVQQPGSCDDDGDADRQEHYCGLECIRRLEGESGRGVPRVWKPAISAARSVALERLRAGVSKEEEGIAAKKMFPRCAEAARN